MALIHCPECDRQVSTQAAACPGCGHPIADTAPVPPSEPAGPGCYSCTAAATTRCQRCGTLSCAEHLQSIYVSRGKGGSYELRCESCYSMAWMWRIVSGVLFVIVLIFILIIWSNMRNGPFEF